MPHIHLPQEVYGGTGDITSDDEKIADYRDWQGVLRDSVAIAMRCLERRPNEGPYLVATGVTPQIFDEWSYNDSAYKMLYDHDSQSVFSFRDSTP
ncbi:uncharacterized protein EV420DRAFT_1635346 [Desarmillaria tabescens]|uniref:Uncharacterized protein n=1 Tax=Armillaria tabescens TaxID=1929756 RepID=A0AA39TRP2_ARMTA|nr:uncharacterized protein EV420DRAFT_1635346 [Desarmillaria tabescens]KAK0468087.1 hypothetical protein EV420DRAFT_1635346 [Desarmillaria tabescens]